MKRDLNKYIKEYREQFENSGNNKGAFYSSDFEQILDISNKDLGNVGAKISNGNLLYSLIDNALISGFMIGYKLGKRSK